MKYPILNGVYIKKGVIKRLKVVNFHISLQYCKQTKKGKWFETKVQSSMATAPYPSPLKQMEELLECSICQWKNANKFTGE